MKQSLKSVVGSLSRALGNDLTRYDALADDVYLLRFCVSLSPPCAAAIKMIIKHYAPRAKIKIMRKRGLIEIRL